MLCISVFVTPGFGQENPDSTGIEERLRKVEDTVRSLQVQFGKLNQDLALTGTRLTNKKYEGNGEGVFTIGGYVSSYFGHYSDTSGPGHFQKFPTASPRNNSFGLDMALLSVQFQHPGLRATMCLQFGDIAASAWSPDFNWIQEANAGFRLHPKFWIDAGFFRTHLGLESIQPRENICQSIARVTYFEPYYLSGFKLSWLAANHLTFQAQILNSFNGFTETNHKKAVGLSCMYEPGSHLSITSNLLYNDDAPDGTSSVRRLYWNTFGSWRKGRWLAGAEVNAGYQTQKDGSGKQYDIWMYSAMISGRYQLNASHFVYSRFEFFRDPDEMLTGPVIDKNHSLVGLQVEGLTLGFEWRPYPNAHIRLEGRGLYTRQDEMIFSYYSKPADYRTELLASMGIWF
jgi:hypothetical protein